ncbi:MAG: hypothetical protein HYX20_02625 [Candidatus Yanofskybacteria bacterium]|nr:hypothetical protein [Candidatus Yanofskybacteria bacterium]
MLKITKPNKFWYAVATLVGSTIGVGIYGIPFAFQKAGFGIGFLFLIGIGSLFLLSNFLYGEVILRTHERHQLVGYTNKYLGVWARKINLFTFMVGAYGALIGIIIISGGFLANVFSFSLRLSPASWSTIFILIVSVFIFRGLRTISKTDFLMMFLFTSIILFIGLLGVRSVNLNNYTLAVKNFWFLPFGIVMFAMSSKTGVPLVREVLTGSEDKFRKALIFGTVMPALLYLVFTFVVVGISGDATSPDAISGLSGFLGTKIIFIGSLFGFLTSFSIFINLGTALKESFQEDFYFSRRWAWLLTMIPPYVLFISGIRNFIDIIGLVGGVAVSIEMIILIFLYAKARKNGDRVPEYSIRVPTPVLYLMMLLFAAGAVYTVLIR